MNEVKESVREVMFAILPVALVVIALQFTIIWLPNEMFIQFLIGLGMVVLGFILFLVGVNMGLLPIG